MRKNFSKSSRMQLRFNSNRLLKIKRRGLSAPAPKTMSISRRRWQRCANRLSKKQQIKGNISRWLEKRFQQTISAIRSNSAYKACKVVASLVILVVAAQL